MIQLRTNKIKLAIVANNLERNGISTVIMNYVSNFNLEKFDITILVGEKVIDTYRKRCESLGVKVKELPHRKEKTFSFYKKLYKELSRGNFDIVHVHGSNASIAIELFLAKINGVKIRIANSHNTTCTNMVAHKLMKPFFNMLYTDGMACGKLAGQWLFEQKEFTVIPNGFNTADFQFDNDLRKSVRKRLGLENKLVLGHIGRFNSQKNHEYILKIFGGVAKVNKDAILLLVGDGPDYLKVKSLVDRSPYKERIILYGETDMPKNLYMAMDIFVFPSRFEGLPVTLLEAQITGLPCIVSDKVTPEVKLSKWCKFLSIETTPDEWIDACLNFKNLNRESFYKENIDRIQAYDISKNSKYLEKIYEDLLNKKEK